MKICCAEGMLLNLTFLKLSVVTCVLIVNISTCNVKVNGFHSQLSILDTVVAQGSSTENISPNHLNDFM